MGPWGAPSESGSSEATNQMRRASRSTFTAVSAPLALILSLATGCTSTLTTAYLSGTPWSLLEPHAASGGDTPDADRSTAKGRTEDSGSPDSAASADAAETPAADTAAQDRDARREAAIEEAVNRLSSLGVLDEATQASLVATLQRTAQEDWPVVVEEFASSLAAAAPAVPAPTAETTTVVKPPADEPTTKAPAPPVPPDGIAEEAVAVTAPSAPAPAPAPEPGPQAPAPSRLLVNNANFASRVQAWGQFERFDRDRFQPGQEVIVYFELDHLAARESRGGHTTCIDTSLRLVGADGRKLHEWNFEPITETCGSRRRDYFARYVVRIPDAAEPGACQLEMTVTDMLADATATASLPLEIAAD